MITPKMAVFPGDTPFAQRFLADMRKGDGYTLSTITSTVHLGAHTDAPLHYSPRGEPMERRDLSYYFGPAQVVSVSTPQGSRIRPDHIDVQNIKAPRVLFKTGSFRDTEKWQSDFSALSAELIESLAKKGVRLVGIDTPSIDLAEDRELESHQAVLKNNMAILEGIVLDHVKDGFYQLIALPLKIRDSDASPVRAVLVRAEDA